MPTVSRGLPKQPHLDIPKREARELLTLWRAAEPLAFHRIRNRHPQFAGAGDGALRSGPFKLADAQLVIAREYGLPSWPALKRRIEANAWSRELAQAIRAGDRDTVRRILTLNPDLLHLPVISANWGPPMSHAANLGQLAIIQDCAALGARDHTHAFGRALLQGQLECARWLLTAGAKITPEEVKGPCECLNAAGLQLLVELGAPLRASSSGPLAPVATVLGTYARNPAGKHACLDILARNGFDLPDTPIMAFHRGQLDRLKAHLARDPGLLNRRFAYREIYPTDLGCPDDGLSALCGTPVAGGTLLHLAIDFDEQEIFDWLLAAGADVNARADVARDGFGGHTPLFNAIVSCPTISGLQQDGAMTRALLARGADPTLRATLRKFLDWIENPRWHEARDVTPREWAGGFPERNWVNAASVRMLGAKAN
ncbi:MAG TPA: hypothetical protein VHO24_10915 [Opitutaceae bacterium]|nr:hypothetical protein [Opitutaceae bacterium]